ncbi:MAG: amidohydrolase family protein [Pirellulaceae bacterium]|jgi:cytosine/adenosine deaminase-related metal-dependent hydrolase|nr:amidohydrolase family protein [Pirellulaceae bacterium]
MAGGASGVAYRARWILPVHAPPLAHGVLSVAGTRLAAVGENLSGRAAVDLGDVAVLPGLVNPHTHLEFAALSQPLGRRGMPFPDWIAVVVAHRRAGAAAQVPEADAAAACVARGLRQSLADGITTVGDIITSDLPAAVWSAAPVRCVAFRELRGLAEDRYAAQLAAARRHLARTAHAPGVQGGLSPHAPYSVSRQLMTMICHMARDAGCPVALHLAESREELELLATGGGPLRTLLEQLGAWHPAAFAQRTRPRDYLEILATAPRSLVIHGNYLGPDDWSFLAQQAARMAVVFCPHTHRYFAHPPYPLAALLRQGVRVVIGTDSRASNPDGSLWHELQSAARDHPDVAPDRIVRMGTLDAAAALGCAQEVGSLQAGKRADLLLVQAPPAEISRPEDILLSPAARVARVMRGGRWLDDQRRQV